MPGAFGLDNQGGTHLLKSDFTVKDVKDVCDGAGSLPTEIDRTRPKNRQGRRGAGIPHAAHLCGKET